MTSLLTPPSRTTAPTAAGRPLARPLWLSAAFAGAVAAGSVLLACMAVGLAGWFAADAGGHGDTRDAIRIGADAWLVAHGSGLTLAGATISVVPLGLTALCGYVALRLGGWARATSADEDGAAVALAAVVLAGVYGVVAVVTAVLATLPTAQPGLVQSFAGAFLLALVGGGAGLVRGEAGVLAGRLPETAVAVLRGAAGIAVAVLAAGAVLVTVALVLDIGTGANVLSRLHADGPGSALYTLVVAAFAPNAALMGGAYLLGPGFAVGTGTVVSPSVVALGPLPAFPLLAALPSPGPGAAWAPALIGVPVLAALLAGALTVRRHPTRDWGSGALRGLGAGVLGGVLVAVLVHLAGGAAGPGRMADVGAPFPDILTAAVVTLGGGSLLGGVLMTWRLRRTTDVVPGDEQDPATEDTIRL
ncbi:MAG TPA: DUF6350 family protein [Nocardioides sp.]|uniref:cell division protein PerM n=1 Tax=Nocardioides sp. TaxID=35761 RepID=UPI002D7E23E6|nr:DUF6350 family protein [Nocardioides sp.]HET6651708.1 DUF6350 family protein [Nocardioides sp.]